MEYARPQNISEAFHTLLKEMEKDDGLLEKNDAPGCVTY